jgi:hypothetical protein
VVSHIVSSAPTSRVDAWELASSARRWDAFDARLEAALLGWSIDELRRMQTLLGEAQRAGLGIRAVAAAVENHSKELAFWMRNRGTHDDEAQVLILLGALAVAAAWLTYRAQPAPSRRIREAIATIDEGHSYLLPIPRSGPCFCGSGSKFRDCHGHPPIAA